MLYGKLDCGNLNPEGKEMGALFDTILAKVNTPATKKAVQAAIDKNKQLAIDKGISQVSNLVGKTLIKTGATDPKALAAISAAASAAASGVQSSFWETNKTKIYIGAGLLSVGAGLFVWMKMKKKKV
jgi:hypothetical protein